MHLYVPARLPEKNGEKRSNLRKKNRKQPVPPEWSFSKKKRENTERHEQTGPSPEGEEKAMLPNIIGRWGRLIGSYNIKFRFFFGCFWGLGLVPSDSP